MHRDRSVDRACVPNDPPSRDREKVDRGIGSTLIISILTFNYCQFFFLYLWNISIFEIISASLKVAFVNFKFKILQE